MSQEIGAPSAAPAERQRALGSFPVSTPVIRPFTADDVEPAGRLLALRHEAHLGAQPLLDGRYAEAAAATSEVASAWRDGASGSVAELGDDLVGYLIGSPKAATSWGPNLWVESAGQAALNPEFVRDLYASAAQRWVDEGHTAHYVVVPSYDDALVDVWFRLGFGQQQAHGLRDLEVTTTTAESAVAVRRATADDISALAALDLVLPQHQRRAPVFSAVEPPPLAEAEAEWVESIGDPTYATFVATVDGNVVGSAVGCALELSSSHTALIRPAHAGFLGFAAVFPDSRGLGAGRRLGESVVAWAGEAGFDCVATDWRVTNVLSSRTWPALGFRTSFLRLHRLVGY